jgi:hypothetical protein
MFINFPKYRLKKFYPKIIQTIRQLNDRSLSVGLDKKSLRKGLNPFGGFTSENSNSLSSPDP